MKLSPEQIAEKGLVLHKRKTTEFRCPVCARDCHSTRGLQRHRGSCKPWVDSDYREQYE